MRPSIRKGDSGRHVADAESYLASLGWTNGARTWRPDAVFDDVMHWIVWHWQGQQGLPQTHVIDRDDWRRMGLWLVDAEPDPDPEPEPEPDPSEPEPDSSLWTPRDGQVYEFVHVNRTSRTDAEIRRIADACAQWVEQDLAPEWGYAETRFSTARQLDVGPMTVVVNHVDNSTVQGALGWHSIRDLDNDGDFEPIVEVSHVGNVSPSRTAAHEYEAVADYWVNTCAMVPEGRWLIEICDPVQATGPIVRGLEMSNFVTKDWFSSWPTEHGRYDLMRLCSRPRHILPGGFQIDADTFRFITPSGSVDIPNHAYAKADLLHSRGLQTA